MPKRRQARNPKSRHWVRRDTKTGRIVSVKKGSGPDKRIKAGKGKH